MVFPFPSLSPSVFLLHPLNPLLSTRPCAQVRVASTESGLHFFKETDLPEGVKLFRDADEWQVSELNVTFALFLSPWISLCGCAPER